MKPKLSFQNKFEMKNLGKTSYVVCIKIHRDRGRNVLGLMQRGYIDKALARFGMQNRALGDTPVSKVDNLVCNNILKLILR